MPAVAEFAEFPRSGGRVPREVEDRGGPHRHQHLDGVECDHRVRLGPVEDALPECTATLEQWMADGVTVVACFNDLYAGLAVKVLRQRGSRIPDDLAVLGVDDEAMSWMLEPPLSTVRLRMAEFGTHLAACGRAVLDGHPLPPLPAGLTPVVARATT